MSAQFACNGARKESFSKAMDAPGSLIVAEAVAENQVIILCPPTN
jgi:hypothetical protein